MATTINVAKEVHVADIPQTDITNEAVDAAGPILMDASGPYGNVRGKYGVIYGSR